MSTSKNIMYGLKINDWELRHWLKPCLLCHGMKYCLRGSNIITHLSLNYSMTVILSDWPRFSLSFFVSPSFPPLRPFLASWKAAAAKGAAVEPKGSECSEIHGKTLLHFYPLWGGLGPNLNDVCKSFGFLNPLREPPLSLLQSRNLSSFHLLFGNPPSPSGAGVL